MFIHSAPIILKFVFYVMYEAFNVMYEALNPQTKTGLHPMQEEKYANNSQQERFIDIKHSLTLDPSCFGCVFFTILSFSYGLF